MNQLEFKFTKCMKRYERADVKPMPRVGKFLGSGISRAVFCSSRGTVIKFAYTTRGIKQNRTECEIYAVFGQNDGIPLAKIIDHAENFGWVVMERAYKVGKLRDGQVTELADEVVDIVSDIHEGNCGLIKGIPKITDYGIANSPDWWDSLDPEDDWDFTDDFGKLPEFWENMSYGVK